MERIQSINPERIAWCCADHGIMPGELASALGIAATSIERVMAGEEGLTFNQLRKVAEYFGRGVLFFLEPGPVDEAQTHTPQFRTLANRKPDLSAKLKTLIERVEKQRAVYLSLREDLDEADQPRFSPPDLPRQNPREAAQIARQWLSLTDENSFDSYRAAVEARGVLVFRTNGYNGKWQIAKQNPVLGFALYDPACPVKAMRIKGLLTLVPTLQRGNAVRPLQRPEALHDAGASGLAPTLERGSQIGWGPVRLGNVA